jgi:hypothetical protein
VEEWRAIPGFEGLYEASSFGSIRSLVDNHGRLRAVPKLRAVVKEKDGYLRVALFRAGKRVRRHVHLLVCASFKGPCPLGLECAHGDGNRANPAADNLEWKTRKENHADKLRHGTHQSGERGSRTKLSLVKVNEIRGLVKAGRRHRDIAAKFEVSKSAIHAIARGKNWSHPMSAVEKQEAAHRVEQMGAQGDLLIMRIDRLPDGLKEEKCGDRIVVAHSESGHHHILETHEARLFRGADPFTCYLQLAGESQVVHNRTFDTHGTLSMGPGIWAFKNQREYQPEGWRRACD